ncbi:hypothetical protein [Tateyamaria sp. SN6-1]|uniref:hypothetical protein n=1 Tax=Tateyamaria sp. SN6-1 TaxID=3092148 RepID=UPI0039F4E894
MTDAEIEHLGKELALANQVVEYGVGGSTLMAVNAGCTRICSAETDLAWIEKASENADLKAAMTDGRLDIQHADLGKVGRWGIPVGKRLRKSWLSYPTAPWIVADAKRVDLVFVDGRFRVASALTSALLGRQGVRILIHDMTSRPRRYRPIRKFLDEVDRVDSLCVFVRKPDVSDADLMQQAHQSLASYY